jgi:hypothetical protein
MRRKPFKKRGLDVAKQLYGHTLRSKPMVQTLENLSAYAHGQAELPLERKSRQTKKPTRLNNDEWNLLMQRLFSGQDPNMLAKQFDVSVKTIYGWRLRLMKGERIPRFTVSDATRKVMKTSSLRYVDENNNLVIWKYPGDPKPEPEPPKSQPASKPPEIRPPITLLVAPSKQQYMFRTDDARLIAFLKREGFEIYSLAKV